MGLFFTFFIPIPPKKRINSHSSFLLEKKELISIFHSLKKRNGNGNGINIPILYPCLRLGRLYDLNSMTFPMMYDSLFPTRPLCITKNLSSLESLSARARACSSYSCAFFVCASQTSFSCTLGPISPLLHIIKW